MTKLFSAVAAFALASSPALADTIVLTSTSGGALFQGTFMSTFPNTTFDFTASLIGSPTGLPVSFTAQFVGESTYDSRFCDPVSSGPTGCGIFSPFSGLTESFTLTSASSAFTYNLPVGFVTLRGNLNFSPTRGATVAIDGPGSAVPEPTSWMLIIAGFGAIGGAMRSRRNVTLAFVR